jgi:ferredoxin
MVVVELKSFAEIKKILANHQRILLVGCGTCATVCLAGGERQLEVLTAALKMTRQAQGKEVTLAQRVLLRQCEPEFVEQLLPEASSYEAILSLGCGAGIQTIAEQIKDIPVYPGVNTKFIGAADGEALWNEKCVACGDCLLATTGGICPIARCAKGLLNGPCGGTNAGKCEVDTSKDCAWVLIYERLKNLGQLGLMREIIAPKDFSKTTTPRTLKLGGREGAKVEVS